MELSSMAKTGLKQAEMGLLVLFGSGYFNNEEWIQIDGLIHKGKYEFTEGPPRHLLDGFDSPLLEAANSKEASSLVNEEEIETLELIDGKSVRSEEQATGRDIWDQSEPTEHVESPASVTTITGSAISSQVDVTPNIPSSAEEVIPASRQSDAVSNAESRTGTLLKRQPPQQHHESSEEYPEPSCGRAPDVPCAKPIPKVSSSESKLAAVLRTPSRHLDTKYKEIGVLINVVYIAARAFDPEPDMQLKIRPGDHLQIIKYIVKNWYYARNLRTNLFGQFNQDVVQVEPYSRMIGISPAEYGPILGPKQAQAIETSRHGNNTLPTDPAILNRSYVAGEPVDALLIARRAVEKDHHQRLVCEVGDKIRILKLLSGVTFTGVNLRTEQHGQVHREVFDEPSKSPHAPTSSRLAHRDYETEAARDWQDDTSVSESVQSGVRSHVRSGSSAAPGPWRSSRLTGLQASSYADSVPARNPSPATSVMSAQEIERLVNKKVQEVLNEQNPTTSPVQLGSHLPDEKFHIEKPRTVCWWWATPGEKCRNESHTCQNLHYYPVDGILAPKPTSKRTRDKDRPKKPPKSLTCWFWHNQGYCDNSEEKCKFSHRWTGEVADKPFWVRSKSERNANADAELDYGEEKHDAKWDRDKDWRREDALLAHEDRVWAPSSKVQAVEKRLSEAYDDATAEKRPMVEGTHWW